MGERLATKKKGKRPNPHLTVVEKLEPDWTGHFGASYQFCYLKNWKKKKLNRFIIIEFNCYMCPASIGLLNQN